MCCIFAYHLGNDGESMDRLKDVGVKQEDRLKDVGVKQEDGVMVTQS